MSVGSSSLKFVPKLLKNNSLCSGIIQRYHHCNPAKLIYCEYGDPVKVVQKEDSEMPQPKDGEVLVRMLAAPVNPADINTIQGKYPSKPKLPAVPGNEGVGEVVKVGSGVKNLKEGDHVVPLATNLGTWQSHLVTKNENLLKVPEKLGLIEAATLTVNPSTAFRMLRDFTQLKPGDTIIQNGANSAVGQSVIQICKAWGLRSVNIVRDRPNLDELKKYLEQLGAQYILTEEELRTTDLFKSGKLAKPKLGLNCVGGKSALELIRHLAEGSPLVTYGGMSREPVTVPTSALIFKDIQFRGFWMTRWSKENATSIDRFEMFEELISMMMNNELQAPAYKLVQFNNYKEALMNTMTIKGMIGKKFVLEIGRAHV